MFMPGAMILWGTEVLVSVVDVHISSSCCFSLFFLFASLHAATLFVAVITA